MAIIVRKIMRNHLNRDHLSAAVARRVGFGIVVCILIFMGACSKDPPGAGGKSETVRILTATAEQENVPVELSGFGTVEQCAEVAIKAQITGVLTDVHFTEGQTVKKNDLLLTLDPRPFDAALKLAQANLAKDEVQLKNAQKEAARQKSLLAKGIASQNDDDNA